MKLHNLKTSVTIAPINPHCISLLFKHLWLTVLVLSASLLSGCYSAKISEPPRTAIEQILLSQASDDVLKGMDLSWVTGKKIFVEEKYFESYDKPYVISLIRQHLAQIGGSLMPNTNQADIIVEIRSGGLGMNTSETLIGIPSLSVPVPFSGPLQTPELAFYKSQKADSIGKFAMFAYERTSGNFVQATGPSSGYAHFHLFKVFGVAWRRTDAPQLKKNAEKKAHDKTKWPATNSVSAP